MYLEFLLRVFPDVMPDLLSAWGAIEAANPPEREAALRVQVLGDPRLGPFARGLLELWYTAVWTPMGKEWNSAYGDHHDHEAGSMLGAAYPEGLIWKTAPGAHPQAAHPTGFGSWAEPPGKP